MDSEKSALLSCEQNAPGPSQPQRLRNPIFDRLQTAGGRKTRCSSFSDLEIRGQKQIPHYGATTPPLEPGPRSHYIRRDSTNLINSLLYQQQQGFDCSDAVVTERSTSTVVAGWNVSNLIQGIGILGLPFACVCAGWISIVVIILVAAICSFTSQLIGKCLYERVDKIDPSLGCQYLQEDDIPIIRTRATYACIAADVWPRFGRKLVSCVVLLELFGATVMYMILLGTSIKPLLDYATGRSLTFAVYTAAIGYALLPFVLVPRMRIIAWFSVFAFIGLFLAIVLILVYTAMSASHSKISWSNLPPPNAQTVPVAIGIIVFSYCAHPVLPGIEGSMKRPESYNLMINVSFCMAAVAKIVVGLLPAMLFGADTKQVVVDNMTANPRLALALNFVVALNVFFSMPLILYVIGEQLDAALLPQMRQEWFDPRKGGKLYPAWLLFNRIVLLSMALLVAIGVPHFALIMGLVGSITGSCLCFIMPAYFHLKLNYTQLSLWQKLVRLLVIIFGCITLVFGVIFSSIRLRQVLVYGESD
ncbi:hypothetical protein Ciccas_012170 [Cichlidogyrus casuarinus]|uniref:Amino acid transporter transmembrane domain-containing protein n=1 Tax=Cichlidogyrus casuarinus TaxID=1844966 RepID=A0ABD2PP83_9PLAT